MKGSVLSIDFRNRTKWGGDVEMAMEVELDGSSLLHDECKKYGDRIWFVKFLRCPGPASSFLFAEGGRGDRLSVLVMC